ncbi:MAG: hypothetical protein ABWJ97_03165 [Thermoproteus sp.]
MAANQVNKKVTVLRFVEIGIFALVLALAAVGVINPTGITSGIGIF